VEELVKYMRALTFLQLQAMTGNNSIGKPEVLLSKAGFTHREIADLLGKTTGAVAKAISRAKMANPEAEAGDE
jgi:DNA-directed RNA polymerase specialized sigma24 family protein